MLKTSKKGDGGAGIQEMMFILAAIGIGIMLFTYGLRVGSSLFMESREETISKDIAYTTMSVLSSPTNMIYTYAPYDDLKDYTISIDSDKVKVISPDDSSATYPILLPEGMHIEPITLQGPLSIPMILKQNTLKFEATEGELEQKCITIASDLTISENAAITINIDGADEDPQAKRIADIVELKAETDPQKKYEVVDLQTSIIKMRIRTTNDGAYIVSTPENLQYTKRFACILESKSLETLQEDFNKFKAEQGASSYDIVIEIDKEIAKGKESEIAEDIFESIEGTIQ